MVFWGGVSEEFDVMRQLLTVFHDNIDDMTKRRRSARCHPHGGAQGGVWDGKVAHVVLFRFTGG